MEHNHGGLENHFPFQMGDFQVNHVKLQGLISLQAIRLADFGLAKWVEFSQGISVIKGDISVDTVDGRNPTITLVPYDMSLKIVGW